MLGKDALLAYVKDNHTIYYIKFLNENQIKNISDYNILNKSLYAVSDCIPTYESVKDNFVLTKFENLSQYSSNCIKAPNLNEDVNNLLVEHSSRKSPLKDSAVININPKKLKVESVVDGSDIPNHIQSSPLKSKKSSPVKKITTNKIKPEANKNITDELSQPPKPVQNKQNDASALTKTYMNEDGYLVTEKCNATTKTSLSANGTTKNINVERKEIKMEKSPFLTQPIPGKDEKKSKKDNKKSKLSPGASAKQASMMDYFKKK